MLGTNIDNTSKNEDHGLEKTDSILKKTTFDSNPGIIKSSSMRNIKRQSTRVVKSKESLELIAAIS